MNKDHYAKYASPEEQRRDQLWEDHLNFQCSMDNACEFCLDLTRCIHEFVDRELSADSCQLSRSCPRCGSTDTIYEGDMEKCARCGW